MGGNLSQLVYLAPYPDFWAVIGYETQFLKIHPYTGGGQHIPAGLPNPPPKILERWLFTHNEMTLKYYIT